MKYLTIIALVTAWGLGGMSHVSSAEQNEKAEKVERSKSLGHEGKSANGLRLESKVNFVPKEEGWDGPKLQTSLTFYNETDREIVLDGYTIGYRLVLSRVSPVASFATSSIGEPPWCRVAPELGDIIRIPAGQKHVVTQLQWWRESLGVRYGTSHEGKVQDAPTTQYFTLTQPGDITLAFLYRSDGAFSGLDDLVKLLKPGERLWEGRVYSNPVVIEVSKLRDR